MTKTKQTPAEKLEARHAIARVFNEAGAEAFRTGLAKDSLSPMVPWWMKDAWDAGWNTAERTARIEG